MYSSFFLKLCMIHLRHVSQENVAFTSLEYAVKRYAFIMSSLYKFNDRLIAASGIVRSSIRTLLNLKCTCL